jgi:hypothetical protein
MSIIKTNAISFMNALKNNLAETSLIKMLSIIIIIVVVTVFIIYATRTTTRNKSNCKKINKMYDKFPKISSINTKTTYNLRDYYVKTAYNACSAGQFKNDFVDVCALKNVIKQGARCLDFEIYSLNDKPIIAVSSINDFYTKGSYNSVNFEEAMGIVADYAFSNSTCPNPNDPLLLHFRIMSNNKNIYDAMSKTLYSKLQSRMLDKRYSYEFNGNNLSNEPIKNLMGKVVIIIDSKNKLYQKTPLDEYVNISSSSVFFRKYDFSQIKNIQDYNELIEFNKKNMTIVTQDKSSKVSNPSSALAMTYGCQFVAMSFQNKDNNLDYYNKIFEDQNSAFVLKPDNLRYIPVTIPTPPPPDPKLSYAERKTETDYYKFKI